ncbi:MAG: hypothetical protein HZA88_01880 [Verrucomicrobia bacterium]|nr:hypothetical protein [Verrucomicrobiota bacterium]
MTSKQRIALAMQHQQPDRVPVMCQLALGHYFLNAPIPQHRIWFTSEGFAEALVLLQRRYRFDGILINLPGRPANVLDDVLRIERTVDGGERLIWKNGDYTLVPPNDSAHHYSADGSTPKRADFATLDPDRLDSLDDLTGYIWNTYHVPQLAEKTRPGPLSEVPEYFFRTIDFVKAAVGNEVSVHGEVFSPFTHLMELFGYEEALMALMTDPAKCHALLDRLTVTAVAWGVAQARRGVDAVLISSAFAGGGFISQEMYREFVLPYERRMTDAIKPTGVPVYTHTCGRIGDRLELMAETGIDGLDTLDPPPLGNVELAEAKRCVGDRLFIKGNMNSVALLDYRTKEQVIAEAGQCIRAGKPGGGYILSTACSVAPRVEPWKLELLTPLAEEIGRYA